MSAPALSPHDIRQHHRQAQRAVRLALNDVNRYMDTWKAAISRGRACALALSNALLIERHLAVLPLGDLYREMPDLRAAATRKLVARQAQQLEGLSAATQELADLAESFRTCTTPVRELVEWQQAFPRLALAPVFKTSSLTELCGLLEKACTAHLAELPIKQGILREFEALAGRLGQEDVLTTSLPPLAADAAKALSTAALEARGQCLVAAWMMSLMADEDSLAADLAAVTADMAGC
ncbi:hypothetical protein ACKKBG_A13090 [Auxenochlorella protothecoides x Auxenochlorella symbiontica]